MTRTSIEWATDSWNPIAAYDRETGKRGWFCTKVSPGCTNCYAEQWNRFRGNGHLYRVGNLDKVRFELAPTLTDPLHWRKPRRVFVNSMTDLFLEAHTNEMIASVFTIMAQTPQHQFLVLTKRPERMLNWFMIQSLATTDRALFDAAGGRWPLPNVWLGVSTENQETADERIPLLVQTPAAIRFLSCEPLLGPIDFHGAGSRGAEDGDPESFSALTGYDGTDPKIAGIDWVIVGGESGAKARPMDMKWIFSIVVQCREANVPVFVKQMGSVPMELEAIWRGRGVTRLLNCRNRERVPEGFVPLKFADRKGGSPDEWPTELRIREYPREAVLV